MNCCKDVTAIVIPVYPIPYELGDRQYSTVLKPAGKIFAISLLSSLIWTGMSLAIGYGCHRLFQSGKSLPGMERLGFTQAIFRTASVGSYTLGLVGLATISIRFGYQEWKAFQPKT